MPKKTLSPAEHDPPPVKSLATLGATSGAKSGVKSRVKGEERRALFLEAACRIIVEQGVSAVTMDEVAFRTDVNKRLGYRYFENREHLLRALFEDRMAEATRRADALLTPDATLKDIVSVNIRVWLDLAERDGPILSRLFSDQDVIPDTAREIVGRATVKWEETLGRALVMSPVAARVLSRIFLTALRGAVEALTAEISSAAEIADIYATAVLAGAEAVAIRFTDQGSTTV